MAEQERSRPARGERDAPLDGVRVVELATGVAGPYAGRLLAMLGASVVKVEPDGGDPARGHPIDDAPLDGTSPLFLHLNAGKRNARGSAVRLETLVDWADVVIDDRTQAELRGSVVDPVELSRRGADVVLASVTPWGYAVPERGDIDDELLVQAASGVPSTEVGEPPRRFPGWQAQYMAGAYAAAGALALAAGPRRGVRHLDVAWITALLSGVEGKVSVALHLSPGAAEGVLGGVQAGAFPAGAFRCADGHVIPGTVRPVDWVQQCRAYDMPELLEDERFTRRQRWAHRGELQAIIQPWYDARKKREIFGRALELDWAFAMVVTASDALGDEHLAARRFLGEISEGARGFTAPVAPWRADGLPVRGQRVARPGEDDAWARRHCTVAPARRVAPPSLDGVRVLELTRAWAGPFVGRFLGGFGADIARVEAARSPDGWRTRMRWKRADCEPPPGADPEAYTWDAAPLYNGLNRNKRGISLDATHARGRDALMRLLERADVMVINMTHRVLGDWDLEYERIAELNPRLVLINMPALGASGPYRSMPGYGMLIEGMGGFAARYGDRDEGARATTTYYPDAVAGIHASLAALAGLARRERTGRGGLIDVSQQEATWLLLGEAIAHASLEGREPARLGAAEPRRSPSGFYPCAGGEWIAVVVRSDAELERLVECAGGALDDMAGLELEVRLAERDRVDAALARWTSPQPAARVLERLAAAGIAARRVDDYRRSRGRPELERLSAFETLVHPVTGPRTYLRVPLHVDGCPPASRSAAPVFDQHTDAILHSWTDLDADDVRALRESGGIGGLPGDGPRGLPGDGPRGRPGDGRRR